MSYPGQPDPYQQPQPPTHYRPAYGPPAPPPRRQPSRGVPVLATVAIAAGALLFGVIVGLGLAGLDPQDDTDPLAAETSAPTAPATETERERSAAEEPTDAPEPETLEIPDDLTGMNAAVAEDQLRELGFTRIEFGSVDAADTVVIVPSNWTVVSVEPEPGSEISADSLVVLTCTKQ